MILFGSVLVAIRARIVVECAALDYVHCGFNDSQCILRKHRQECLCHTAAPLITSLTGGAGVAQTLLSVLVVLARPTSPRAPSPGLRSSPRPASGRPRVDDCA